MTRVVAALGGNALLRRGVAPSVDESQREHVETAADVVAALALHELVVTHGNGPQVGLLALQAEAAGSGESLDVLNAQSEGMIGYVLEREIRNRLPSRPVVTLVTQVQVDADDPAFQTPSKPIGPVFELETATRLADRYGWNIAPEDQGWRRVVASPSPRRILELDAIDLLLGAGHLVICAGGGGIPVAVGKDGALAGVEAVIDKDRSAALLATGLRAEALLLLTDEPAIFADWPDRRRPIRRMSADEARTAGLDRGSMGPKAAAAADFIRRGGGLAVIGALEDAVAMIAGDAGTRIVS